MAQVIDNEGVVPGGTKYDIEYDTQNLNSKKSEDIKKNPLTPPPSATNNKFPRMYFFIHILD